MGGGRAPRDGFLRAQAKQLDGIEDALSHIQRDLQSQRRQLDRIEKMLAPFNPSELARRNVLAPIEDAPANGTHHG